MAGRRRRRTTSNGIEERPSATGGSLGHVDESKVIEITPANNIGFIALARTLFVHYPRRSILGASLMITQSFLYNAIFFTYALVLTKIYHVPATDTAYYFIAFAIGNLIGPLTIGHLFDTIGRRKMIAGTYILSGILLAISAVLFNAGALNAVTQTACWCVIFFFASAGASLGLPDRERDLSGRGPGQGHRRLLRHRPELRRLRALALRRAHRQRPGPFQAVHRLPDRSRRHGRRRHRRDLLRCRRRAEVARGHRPAPLGHRPSPHLSAVTGAPRPPAARSTLA